MTDTARCKAGDWVEVEYVLLEPAERSSSLPPETAQQPLRVWVKGFARGEATVGEELSVDTMTGRVVTGQLTEVNPGYTHTFGKPAPELVHVGRELRERLATHRALEPSAAGDATRPPGPDAESGGDAWW